MPDSEPDRSRFLPVLGFLAVAMGLWGGYFGTVAYHSFHQMVQRSGPPGGPYNAGPRPEIEPWVLTYCAASALLMVATGMGLLFRRRWGPALAGFSGTSWTITSFGFFRGEVRLLRGVSMSPSSYRLVHIMYAGGSFVALIFGLLCLSCLIRRPVREECGARAPTRILLIAIMAWAGAATIVAKVWYDWCWETWAFF